MKRTYIISLLITICSVCCYGQQSFFDKYAEMDGVTSVYITKSMLSLFPKGQAKINGMNIGDIASRLNNIQILSSEKAEIIAKLREETSEYTPRNGYEELMRIREDGTKTTIYFKNKKKEFKEFILIVDEKDEFTIISIAGDLTLEEIKRIMNEE